MNQSLQKQIQKRKISIGKALDRLSNNSIILQDKLIDFELCDRFFRQSKNLENLAPLVPLLLWQSCYYLGSPN
ncbi:MAG: hypothetical protein WBA10_09660, partial [Elainellaceae cyanobacterium]